MNMNITLNITIVDLRGDNAPVGDADRGWYVQDSLFESAYDIYMNFLLKQEGEYVRGHRNLVGRKINEVHHRLTKNEVSNLIDCCEQYKRYGTKVRVTADTYFIPAKPIRHGVGNMAGVFI